MGYQTASGRFANTAALTLKSSGAVTANGSDAAVEVGDRGAARLLLDVTAVSGTTPSMTVTVETSYDGSTNWQTVGSFAAKTAVGQERKVFAGLDRFVRVSQAVSGTTPSFTYSVAGEAV